MNSTGALPLFAWTEDYSVSVDGIDSQHKQLVLVVSQLHRAVMQDRPGSVLMGLVERLVACSDAHFADEEEFMREQGYPRLSAHAAEHRRLSRLIRNIREDFLNSGGTITAEALQLIRTWLNDHMLGMDQEYAEHFRQQKKARPATP